MDRFRTYRLKLFMAKVLRLKHWLGGDLNSICKPSVFLPSFNPDSKDRAAVIDNSYHSKTISSSFFMDLLRQQYSVQIFWDNQWEGGRPASKKEINSGKFEILILWQIFIYYNPSFLADLRCQSVIIVPMYDDAHAVPNTFFHRYRSFSFISFSQHFQERFTQIGIKTKYFQFFPDPATLPFDDDDFSALHGFFWQRTNDITWEHIRHLIDGTKFSSFHLHLAIDPLWYKEIMPTEEEMNKYHITISRWFDKKEDYLAILSKANVFFSPRLYEGIGMPFIEAMTMGKVVVSPDYPTMNEYIHQGINGILYDPGNLKPLDFSKARIISGNARQYCLNGYTVWKESRPELLSWLKS